jgi:hypothetical protein
VVNYPEAVGALGRVLAGRRHPQTKKPRRSGASRTLAGVVTVTGLQAAACLICLESFATVARLQPVAF